MEVPDLKPIPFFRAGAIDRHLLETFFLACPPAVVFLPATVVEIVGQWRVLCN
jgi:hypothetical protein